jgi:hypothetical protein
MCALIGILETTPATDIENEDYRKVRAPEHDVRDESFNAGCRQASTRCGLRPRIAERL